MATFRPEDEGRVVVRLSQVPEHLRRSEAEAFARVAKLAGLEALAFKARSVGVWEDCQLVVPAWKAELVLAGKRVAGAYDVDLVRSDTKDLLA